MNPDDFQCPEDGNSTDCLLRALLSLLGEQQEADDVEIDWDPINFAFTLLIGLLAIFFALATVIQAIFAAGKGRRRTSHLAIGQWSQRTTRRWDWSEMNFQFTAFTPILREASLPAMPSHSGTTEHRNGDHVDGKHDKGHAEEEPAQGVVDSTGLSHTALKPRDRSPWADIWKITSKIHPNQSRRPFAAWLGFFKEVGLDELDCQVWGDSVREVAADYLPDDLVAAPAYAQIGAIVAAAATAGIQKLDTDQQDYPILLGRGFQVDFRQHPALGVVGAYSRYDNTTKQSRSLSLEELRLAMRYGRGIVEADPPMDLSNHFTKRQVIERWRMAPKRLALRRNPSPTRLFVLKLATDPEAYVPLIAGISAHTPKCVPALFPTTTIGATGSRFLTALALNGNFWANARLDKFKELHIFKWPKFQDTPDWHGFDWAVISILEASPGVRQLYVTFRDLIIHDSLKSLTEIQFEISGFNRSLINAERIAEASRFMPASEPEPEPGPKPEPETTNLSIAEVRDSAREEDMTSRAAIGEPEASHGEIRSCPGHPVVLQMCLKLLREPEKLEEWLSEMSPDSQRALRLIVLEQMRDVDQWLRETQVDVEGQSVLLGNTTIVLLQAEQMIQNKALRPLSPGTPVDQIGKRQPDEQDQWQSTSWAQPERNTAREIHLETLKTLRNLVDNLNENKSGVRELESLLDVYPVFPTNHLWDRMSTLLVYHFEEEPHWPLWERFHEERDDKSTRDIDDVIIYRCLMMILLFRTAADSSKILESGLWDKVVPMI